jgi:phosphocarrier protein
MTAAKRTQVRIVNPMGLHARPAGRFVAVAADFDAHIRVACRGEEVDGGSILSLLMLEAMRGMELRITATGPQAEQALAALGELVAGGFEEPESVDGRGARG